MANNLIKQMKERIAKSGSSKKEVLYFAPDSTKRIRFLADLEDGIQVQFHSDFETHIYEICKDPEEHENCPLCKEGISILEQFAWPVWDYDSNAQRILCVKASGISPIPALIELYEEYGTLIDRDIKIKKVGKGVGGSFTVTPLDKSRFRNAVKPYTEKQMLDIFAKAFASSPYVETEDKDEDEAEETPKKKSKKSKKEPTLRDKFEELDEDTLRDICSEIGMSKKEIRALETEEDIIDELFDNYEETDLEDLLNEYEDEEE